MRRMKSLIEGLGRAILIVALIATTAQAQDTYNLMDAFEAGELNIEEGPSLEQFALEWDRAAAAAMDTGEPPQPDQYRALSEPDQGMLDGVLSALINNDEMTTLLQGQAPFS